MPPSVWFLCLAWLAPIAVSVALLVQFASVPKSAVVHLGQAHAHNDYHHDRPVHDALQHGFASIEADIHLEGGYLVVKHDADEAIRGMTLQHDYLDPLRAIVQQNGGTVYPNGVPFTLLIDIKTDAEPTYRRLHQVLESYSDIITSFGDNIRIRLQHEDKAIVVVVSGNRPFEHMMAQRVRYACYDGRVGDLAARPNVSAGFMPLISDEWSRHFTWDGNGEMDASQREKLQRIVQSAHASGRRLRFWGTPEAATVWHRLLTDGVDMINTDDLDGLRDFLLRYSSCVYTKGLH